MKNDRLYTLDYLRGIAAFGIMIFHYTSWISGDPTSESFIGKIGIYGVSIFYVLSGLTLHHVYASKLTLSPASLGDFYLKRFFRIFPLLWLVTVVTIVLSRTLPDPFVVFLNLTGLFGFIQWDAYIGTGVWSIGNELVFYVFFPVFVFLSRKSNLLFYSFSLFLLLVYLLFAFRFLTESNTLAEQWANYVNPLNQVFLFLGGFLIGHFSSHVRVTPLPLAGLAAVSIIAFVLYPVEGNAIYLVTDWNRVVFTILCLSVCFCFYKFNFSLPVAFDWCLAKLGEASYSIYLIHPIVWKVNAFVIVSILQKYIAIPTWIQFATSVILTLVISYLTYIKFEKRFMNYGRTILSRVGR